MIIGRRSEPNLKKRKLDEKKGIIKVKLDYYGDRYEGVLKKVKE